MDWTAEPGRFDEIVEDKGARVLINSKAVMFFSEPRWIFA